MGATSNVECSTTNEFVGDITDVRPSLARLFLAEGLGTFLLVLFGCGSVHTAVLLDAQVGLWQIAIVWGVAIMLAIYVVGSVSGAHLNPAITLALAAWGRFAWRKVPLYIVAQLCGAMLAAAALYLAFSSFLVAKEQQKKVLRGEFGSIITATCYGEYFSNPGGFARGSESLPMAELQSHLGMVTNSVAFMGFLTVYIVAPVVGAWLGAALYERGIRTAS